MKCIHTGTFDPRVVRCPGRCPHLVKEAVQVPSLLNEELLDIFERHLRGVGQIGRSRAPLDAVRGHACLVPMEDNAPLRFL